MGFFLPACVTGLSDFDARRALRALALFWLGFMVLRAMGTLPRRQGSSNRNQPRHYISASRRIGSPLLSPLNQLVSLARKWDWSRPLLLDRPRLLGRNTTEAT